MGSLVNNNTGSQIMTLQQIAAWVAQNPLNLISYFCNRNPTAVYRFMIRNYPMFGRMSNGLQATDTGISDMYKYIVTQYNALPTSAQPDWLTKFGNSMPDAGELNNWTNPKTA